MTKTKLLTDDTSSTTSDINAWGFPRRRGLLRGRSRVLTNIASRSHTVRLIANSNTLAATSSVTPLTADPLQKRLVARWLVDENSKLYCQWMIED